MSNEKEVEVLLAGEEVTVRGEVLKVKPYNWVQTFKMAKPFKIVMQTVIDNAEKVSTLTSFTNMSEIQQVYAILDFIASVDDGEEFSNALAELIAGSIGKDTPYVKELDIDEVITVGMAVFKVNKSFFSQKLGKIAKLFPAPKKKEK
jgi:hypothetical protein|nr:MAG TPA: hypothetical protein [Caudoviricetes sp.]